MGAVGLKFALTLSLLMQLFAFGAPVAAQQPTSKDAEQAVLQVEGRWLAAIDNPEALQSILADDFVHVLASGFITKAQQIAYVRSHPRNSNENRRFEDLRVRIYGSVGVATGVVITTAPDQPKRKTAFTDVFAYRDRRWQAVNAQENALDEHTHS